MFLASGNTQWVINSNKWPLKWWCFTLERQESPCPISISTGCVSSPRPLMASFISFPDEASYTVLSFTLSTRALEDRLCSLPLPCPVMSVAMVFLSFGVASVLPHACVPLAVPVTPHFSPDYRSSTWLAFVFVHNFILASDIQCLTAACRCFSHRVLGCFSSTCWSCPCSFCAAVANDLCFSEYIIFLLPFDVFNSPWNPFPLSYWPR